MSPIVRSGYVAANNAHTQPASVGEDHRPLRARGVEHHAEVVHQHLDRREVLRREPIGEPGAPAVGEDQARERREATQEPGAGRMLPGDLEVVDEPREEDEIDRPSPIMVRERDVAVPRVPTSGRPSGVCSVEALRQAPTGGRSLNWATHAGQLRIVIAKPGLDGHDRGARSSRGAPATPGSRSSTRACTRPRSRSSRRRSRRMQTRSGSRCTRART
jgi:hypothetical protein